MLYTPGVNEIDLDGVLAEGKIAFDTLRGARLFITGGTGFFGCWLLETLIWANERLGLEAEAVVLTRDAHGFASKAPHLAGHRSVRVRVGDVLSLRPDGESFSHVIHAATEANATLNAESPLVMFDTIVTGTRNVLELARCSGASRFLVTSSGAVYGRQPPDLTHVSEDYLGGPACLAAGAAYGEGKRAAEFLTAQYAQAFGLEAVVARCFAFVGPYLPIDKHFAVGNFIRDALTGGPIRVGGDGTPYRSYLYAADLALWLWVLLARGVPGRAYNVGSEHDVTILELAERVASESSCCVQVARAAKAGVPSERYVPSTARARDELGLAPRVELDDAIGRTVRWHRARAAA